jgi:c-di-GMP-binding flagellar brake protein YcgR
MMEEKRRYIRIDAPMAVAYKLDGRPSAIIKKTVTKDFSEGGMRFIIYEKLEVGALIELHIEAPFDTIPIFAKAQVVWTKPLDSKEGRQSYEAGVQFTQMSRFDK